MAAPDVRQYFQWRQPFPLTLGGMLPEFQLAYETWGTLNEDKSNVVLLFTGLSASSHAKSHDRSDTPGWWEAMIGPGLGLDTDDFFVICFNHLGGCFGSTGPASIDPRSDRPYGPEFPPLMIQDLVRAAHLAVKDLGIEKIYAATGASMGGMLALEYAAQRGDEVEKVVMISASGRPGAQSIAFRFVQRQVILSDPHFQGGWYYDKNDKPVQSMVVARQIGNITYRSSQEFNERFGRQRTTRGFNFGPDFQVESYLHHMGHKLATNFDANSFLFLSKSMDLYSLGYGFPTYEKGVARISAKTLVIGVTTDMLFPIDEQEQVATVLKKCNREATFVALDSYAGHDAFLVEVDFFRDQLRRFLTQA